MNTMTTNYGGKFFALGILLIIIGILAILTPFVATVTAVMLLGWLLIIGGLVRFIFAFFTKGHTFYFPLALLGILSFFIGLLIVLHPAASMLTLTLILGLFFLVAGFFRLFGSLTLRFENWGWFLCSGIIAILLGILILIHWPSTALWVLGLFIGIDFILTGISLAMSGTKMRKLST